MAGPACARPAGSEGPEIALPLGGATSGRLVFAGAVSGLRLQSEAGLADLLRARFAGAMPCLRAEGGCVSVRCGSAWPPDRLAHLGQPPALFALNAAIPWEIEFRGGLARLDAELASLPLRSLDVLGGAVNVRLYLARPAGTAFIFIEGGARQALLLRPPGVSVRLRASGGVSGLVFDNQRIAPAGGEFCLASPGYDRAADRYDICIAGGASEFEIGGLDRLS